LLDAEEYEVLMGLVAAGRSLISILELKTTPLWRERDFKAMLIETLGPHAGQLPFIDQEFRRGYRAMLNLLRQPPPEPLPLPTDLAA
jgi:hypothetical protein